MYWDELGQTWVNLEPTCAILGPSWATLEPSWANLGPSWTNLELTGACSMELYKLSCIYIYAIAIWAQKERQKGAQKGPTPNTILKLEANLGQYGANLGSICCQLVAGLGQFARPLVRVWWKIKNWESKVEVWGSRIKDWRAGAKPWLMGLRGLSGSHHKGWA